MMRILLVALCAWFTTTKAAFLTTTPYHRSSSFVVSKKFKAHHNDRFDMEDLKRRIHQVQDKDQDNPYKDLFAAVDQPPESVYIVLFPSQKGIHTIQDKTTGRNVLLAFESKQACDKFAALLKEQELFDPTPQKVDLDSLDAFGPQGVWVQVVPKGVDVIPPKQTVEHLRNNDPSLLDHLLDLTKGQEEGVLVQDYSWE